MNRLGVIPLLEKCIRTYFVIGRIHMDLAYGRYTWTCFWFWALKGPSGFHSPKWDSSPMNQAQVLENQKGLNWSPKGSPNKWRNPTQKMDTWSIWMRDQVGVHHFMPCVMLSLKKDLLAHLFRLASVAKISWLWLWTHIWLFMHVWLLWYCLL